MEGVQVWVEALGGVTGQKRLLGRVRDGELSGVSLGRGGEESDRVAGFETRRRARFGVRYIQLSSEAVDGLGERRVVRVCSNRDSQTSVVMVRQSVFYLVPVAQLFCPGLIGPPRLVCLTVHSFRLHVKGNSFCVVRKILEAWLC